MDLFSFKWLSSDRNNLQGIRLFSSHDGGYSDDDSGSDNDDNDDGWKVPKFINIPEDQLDLAFVRSSGSGGQNVNKVSSQVQVRMHLQSAHWIPFEVRQRLAHQQAGRINKEGIFTLHVQEHRTQTANRKTAMNKLQGMILQAWPRPKERKLRKGLSRGTKMRRKVEKRKRGEVKKNRRSVDLD
jgi:protein subunit release factor B